MLESLEKNESFNDALYIESIYSRLTEKENKIRRFLMSYTIDTKRPFNINLLEAENLNIINLSKEELKKSLVNMQKKITLSMDKEGNVNFVYPVSAIKTNHKVTLEDGRTFYAMCAIDSIGSSFAFKQEVTIESSCSECSEKVLMKVKDGQIKEFSPKGLQILHVDLNKYKNWADSCWNIMNFFCKKRHYDEWIETIKVDKESVFCLDTTEALKVSKMIFDVEDI